MHPQPPLTALQFYTTANYPCSYLADRQARSQVATPAEYIDTELYGQLIRIGFRRSGSFTYRPWCDNCRACVPVRVDVAGFHPGRSQRRNWQANAGLVASEHGLHFSEAHYALYQHYQASRHAGGGMDQDAPEQYRQFMLDSQIDSRLIEFREQGELRMVSLIDCLADGLSSVYTFFDPERSAAGLGTYGILWQIEACRRLQLPYLYLGYWIGASPKMAYKARFAPLQAFHGGEWIDFDALPDTRRS